MKTYAMKSPSVTKPTKDPIISSASALVRLDCISTMSPRISASLAYYNSYENKIIKLILKCFVATNFGGQNNSRYDTTEATRSKYAPEKGQND